MTTLPNYPAAASPLVGSELIPVWQDGAQRGATANQVLAPGIALMETYVGATLQLTWAALEGVVGSQDGQVGVVPQQDGNHTDPVTGESVPNSGFYSWSAAHEAWTWTSATQAGLAEVQAGVAASYSALTQATAASVRRALVIDYGDTGIVEAPSYRLTAGRSFRNALGRWEFTTLDNQEAVHYDLSGNIQGIDFSPAASYIGAPFNTGTTPATTDPLYIAKGTSGSDAVISYAGSHTQPSIYTTAGRGVAISLGTSAAVQDFRLSNLKADLVSGDLIRFGLIIGFTGVVTAQTFILYAQAVSGAVPNVGVTMNVAADGTITSLTSSARRYGFVPHSTSGGVQFYFVFVEGKATAAGTIAPILRSAAYVAGMGARIALVEDINLLKNGHTLPNMAPVCGTKTFGDSYYQTSATDRAINMKAWRMKKGRTRITDGSIRPVAEWRSGPNSEPYLHAESLIELELSSEPDSNTYLLPNRTQALDLTPTNLAEPFFACLGDCYYDADIAVGTGTHTAFEIRGAFSAPKRWGQYRSVSTNTTRNTGTITHRQAHCFPRGATSGEQIGQSFVVSFQLASLGLCDIEDSCFSGITQHYTRGRDRTYFNETYKSDDARWIGCGRLGGVNFKIRDVCFNRLGRAMDQLAGANATAVTYDIDGVRGERVWSDMFGFGRGVLSGSIKHAIRQGSTVALYDVYHARDQLCVDVGNGIQTLDAAGLTVTDLPTDRQLHLHSYRPDAGQAIATDAVSRFLWGNQNRTSTLYPPSTEGGSYPGYMANMIPPLTASGAKMVAGDAGPKYETLAAAQSDVDAGVLPLDMLFYVYATDAGDHIDPYTGASVFNRGVYRVMRGLGAVRLADTWPNCMGTNYATAADLQAALNPVAHARGFVTTAGADFGPWEWTGAAWVHLATTIPLPVYASTPGVASADNPHIYATIDVIKKTGTSTFSYLTSAAPAVSGASTHPDMFQLSLQYTTLNNFTISNCVLWDYGQFLFLQGGVSSYVQNFEASDNIAGMDMYNAVYARPEAWQAGYTQKLARNLIVPFKVTSGYNTSGEGSYPWLDATNIPAGQIVTEGNWIAAPAAKAVDTNPAALTNPSGHIFTPTVTNYGTSWIASTPAPNNPGMEDALSAAQLDRGFAIRSQPFLSVSWSDSFQAQTGLNLTATRDGIAALKVMSPEFDAMLDWLSETFQREPDYVFTVAASAAVGTVIATGIDGARWDRQWGGGELGQFSLIGGTLTVAAALTGLNFVKSIVTDTGKIVLIDVQ